MQNKTNSLRVVEEGAFPSLFLRCGGLWKEMLTVSLLVVLRQKVLASGAGGPQAQAQAA